MNSFILWCYHHRDLIIFSAIALSSFAGYATAQDIMKVKLQKNISLLIEELENKICISPHDKDGLYRHGQCVGVREGIEISVSRIKKLGVKK